MTDTEYLGEASSEVKEIDWYKLLEQTDECEYNDADYSLTKLKQLTKNNPTEIGNSTDPDRESPSDNKPDRKRKFRSRGESKVIAPPSWLIADLIQESTNVGIYAPSQFLKSFTAIDLAGALATGKPALGSLAVARSGPVFYAAGEGKANLEKKRITAWEMANGLEPYGADNLYVGEGLIANDDETISADIGEIKEILGGRSAVAIVIDTLALALNGLDEDKSHVAARYFHFLNRLRNETGASVTISVGHFGKDAERGERGSSAFQGSYDTILWVKKHHKDEDTGTHTIQLWVRKQKDGEDGANYYLQSKPVQTPDGDSMVLVPIEESDARDLLDGKRQLSKSDVECALKELCRGGGHVSKRTLATHLANRLQMTVSGVEKALDRKFKTSEFYNDGRWRLRVFLDGDETFAEQMKAARADYINGRVVDAASGTEIFS